MNRTRFTQLALTLVALTFAFACGSKKEEPKKEKVAKVEKKPEKPKEKKKKKPKMADLAPTEPSTRLGEVPVSEDLEAEADRTVAIENLEAELDRLEAEIIGVAE